jgi:hypothetical protein
MSHVIYCSVFSLFLTYSIMVFKATGYLITYNQAHKLVPEIPQIGSLGSFTKWLEAMDLSKVVTPMPIWWFTVADELDDFILLVRASCDNLKSTSEHFSAFVESKGNREMKKALEKLLGGTVSEFTTIPDPYDVEW